MNVKGYIVHLERAERRRPQALALAAALPLPAELLPAVDGRLLADADRAQFVRRRLHAPRYPFAITPTEIGCFLSHRRAWQAILDDGCDAGIIAEDDVAPAAPEFDAVIEAALAGLEPHDFLRFPLHTRGDAGPAIRTLGPARFLEPRLPGLGMQMQLVGREAARRLLEASHQFDRPVDSFVQMQWLHGARVLAAYPVVIQETDLLLGGSVVQNKRMDLVDKMVHEFHRPLHRLAVRTANEIWRRRAA